MRIGIFGGTFDPVHFGHLLLAESCREQCKLDRVLFVPAATAPHKTNRETGSDEHRLNMLKIACGPNDGFQVSPLELERGGVSYTVDTLLALREQFPSDELFLLLGGDSLADLPSWRQPQKICELAVPVAVERPGFEPCDYTKLAEIVTPQRLDYIATFRVTMPLVQISSTDLRQRAATDRTLRYQVPEGVLEYIQQNRLYGC